MKITFLAALLLFPRLFILIECLGSALCAVFYPRAGSIWHLAIKNLFSRLICLLFPQGVAHYLLCVAVVGNGGAENDSATHAPSIRYRRSLLRPTILCFDRQGVMPSKKEHEVQTRTTVKIQMVRYFQVLPPPKKKPDVFMVFFN